MVPRVYFSRSYQDQCSLLGQAFMASLTCMALTGRMKASVKGMQLAHTVIVRGGMQNDMIAGSLVFREETI